MGTFKINNQSKILTSTWHPTSGVKCNHAKTVQGLEKYLFLKRQMLQKIQFQPTQCYVLKIQSKNKMQSTQLFFPPILLSHRVGKATEDHNIIDISACSL